MLGAVDAGGRTCSESEKRKPIGGVAGTFLRNSEITRSAMPGSPIQEQIRAWMQICGRKVAYLEKSQKNETSRPTFASSNLRKPPKGGFLLILPPSRFIRLPEGPQSRVMAQRSAEHRPQRTRSVYPTLSAVCASSFDRDNSANCFSAVTVKLFKNLVHSRLV